MRAFWVAASLGFTHIACAQHHSLTAAESALGRAANIPDSALQLIRSASTEPLGALRPLDSLGNLLGVQGVAIALSQDNVRRTLQRLRERLGPGYVVLHTDQNFGTALDSVGIIRTGDPIEALRIRSTSGVNYDISVDSVIVLYRAWNEAYGLALEGAGPDFLLARIQRQPRDYSSFAKAVFAACPDVVEQGTNTVEALADEMRRTALLYCW